MRKKLVIGALAAVVTALLGVPGTNMAAHAASQTWSIVVHFEYENGFNYDYTIARNVSTSEMPKYLADCGRSHWSPSVVRYRCFPVPE